VSAPLPLISFIESPVGASRFVYSRCCAHDFPERRPSLFDPAHIARCQSSRQSLRQYPRQRNSIMLDPQSGQTRLRIAEIKLELAVVTTASEAIMSLPVVAVLHRRMHRTLSAGPQEPFADGARLDRGCGPSLRIQRATESPNALHGTSDGGNTAPPCSQSSHLEVHGLTKRGGLVCTKHFFRLPYRKRCEWKFECRGEGCRQRQRDHQVTVWQSVTLLTLRRMSVANTARLTGKVGFYENRLA
jgi:hypothetical protein